MRKFVNVRLPVLLALALCAGCATGMLLYYYGISAAWIAAAVIPAVIIFSSIWIYRRSPYFSLFLTLALTALFVGGAMNFYYTLVRYADCEINTEIVYKIHGTVIEKGLTSNGEYIIIDSVTADGQPIKGKTYVFLSKTYGEWCDVGYTVDFSAPFEAESPFTYGELNFRAEDNIKYFSSVFFGLQSTYHYSFFGSMRSAVWNTLQNNVDGETAAITFAMLTGNTQRIDDETLNSFRYGGVAHIFAVSGLHIGILYGICTFVSKKLRLNKYLGSALSIGLLIFYSAFCGFALSSVRAVIMCAVSCLSGIILKRYDGLNSLSVAVILILSISPLSLFSVGFQLSVCAVGGIFVFSKLISSWLHKIKIPAKISSAIGISFGAQMGTLPIMLSSFGYLSGIGLLLNLIVVPLISPVFTIASISTFLCTLIPPIAPFVMPYAVLPLEFLMSVFINGGFENALISGFGAGLFIPIYFVGILAVSDKLNLKFLTRLVALGCTIVILTSYVLMRTFYPFNGYSVIISGFDDGGEVLIKSPGGNVLILTDDVSTSRLADMLNRNYSGTIGGIIILGEDSLSLYPDLDVNCDEIYVFDRFDHVQPYKGIEIHYVKNFTLCGVGFQFFDENSLLANVGGVDFGVCSEENERILRCDIFISDDKTTFVECGLEVYFNNRLGPLNAYDCGDIEFRIIDGQYETQKIPPR